MEKSKLLLIKIKNFYNREGYFYKYKLKIFTIQDWREFYKSEEYPELLVPISAPKVLVLVSIAAFQKVPVLVPV